MHQISMFDMLFYIFMSIVAVYNIDNMNNIDSMKI
jgi:hypothetical protein